MKDAYNNNCSKSTNVIVAKSRNIQGTGKA